MCECVTGRLLPQHRCSVSVFGGEEMFVGFDAEMLERVSASPWAILVSEVEWLTVAS
jgi:hypothetical protein